MCSQWFLLERIVRITFSFFFFFLLCSLILECACIKWVRKQKATLTDSEEKRLIAFYWFTSTEWHKWAVMSYVLIFKFNSNIFWDLIWDRSEVNVNRSVHLHDLSFFNLSFDINSLSKCILGLIAEHFWSFNHISVN